MLASRAYLIQISRGYNGRKKKISKLSTAVWGVLPHTEHGPTRSVTGWVQWCPVNGICCFISRGRDNWSFHCHTHRGIINQPGSNCLHTALVTSSRSLHWLGFLGQTCECGRRLSLESLQYIMIDVQNGKSMSKIDMMPNGPCRAGAHLDLSYSESKQGFKKVK